MSAALERVWTGEEDAMLRDLHSRRLSYSEIAQNFIGRNRNAIAGRVKRLGLSGPKGGDTWTPERVAKLREFRAANKPFTDMAIALGIGVGAIAGKIRRLGLAATVPVKRVNNPLGRKASYLTKNREIKPKKAPVPREPDPAPDMKIIPLTALTPFVCHFPVGDPRSSAFGFCGAPKDGPQSYCSYHHRIAYYAISSRRDDLTRLAGIDCKRKMASAV